jgi:hypothetical protein
MSSENKEIVRQTYQHAEDKGIEAFVGGMLKPTGKRIGAPCADVFKLVDGKIKRFDCYPSGTVVLTQLGVLENLSAAFE